MRRFALHAIICAGVFMLWAGGASAERRVALVIGNSNYVHTAPLPNPANDARAIAAALKRLDFDVVLALDVTQNEMAQPLSEFSKLLEGADVSLLFYAGHGLSFEGRNYLVPVDAKAESHIHVKFQMTPIERVSEEMARSVRLNIIILDACRNNPLATQLARSMGGQSRSTDVARGLSVMRPVGQESVILFATAPGEVAADGQGAHSPFTNALLSHIETSTATIEDVFRDVRRDVREATRNQQLPEMWLRLESRFQFHRDGSAPIEASKRQTESNPAPPARNNGEDDRLYWESVRSLGDAELFRKYIEEFPRGRYVAIAESMIAKLSSPAATEIRSAPIIESKRAEPKEAPLSPSFNCKENRGPIEQIICNDPALARLDLQLSELYFRTFGRMNRDEGLRLRKEQRDWLQTRNACTSDAECVKAAYTKRIEVLQAASQ